MKKKKVTYGVYNTLEWHALLKVGKARLRVSFINGAVTTNGVIPAIYTTSDPVVQMAIEQSKEYAAGKIRVVRSVPLNEEVRVEKNEEIEEPRTESIQSREREESEEPRAESRESEEGSETKPVGVEFACNDDAKDYLEETFGFVRSKLRNREDIVAAGKSKGVDIIFV